MPCIGAMQQGKSVHASSREFALAWALLPGNSTPLVECSIRSYGELQSPALPFQASPPPLTMQNIPHGLSPVGRKEGSTPGKKRGDGGSSERPERLIRALELSSRPAVALIPEERSPLIGVRRGGEDLAWVVKA